MKKYIYLYLNEFQFISNKILYVFLIFLLLLICLLLFNIPYFKDKFVTILFYHLWNFTCCIVKFYQHIVTSSNSKNFKLLNYYFLSTFWNECVSHYVLSAPDLRTEEKLRRDRILRSVHFDHPCHRRYTRIVT